MFYTFDLTNCKLFLLLKLRSEFDTSHMDYSVFSHWVQSCVGLFTLDICSSEWHRNIVQTNVKDYIELKRVRFFNIRSWWNDTYFQWEIEGYKQFYRYYKKVQKKVQTSKEKDFHEVQNILKVVQYSTNVKDHIELEKVCFFKKEGDW